MGRKSHPSIKFVPYFFLVLLWLLFISIWNVFLYLVWIQCKFFFLNLSPHHHLNNPFPTNLECHVYHMLITSVNSDFISGLSLSFHLFCKDSILSFKCNSILWEPVVKIVSSKVSVVLNLLHSFNLKI